VKRGILPWILVLIPLACLRAQPPADSKEAATTIWEQMIDAKGGRKHLYQIETMVQEIHQHLSFHNPRFKDGDSHFVKAFAFPDREWDWSMAPLFGGRVITANSAEGSGYVGFPDNEVRKTSDIRREKEFIEHAQLVYLNESRWLKPKPVRVLLDRDIPHNVEAIETDLDGERVDFWI